ncbi:sulfite exporter TauE/SafE family protein, partial [bacterium]
MEKLLLIFFTGVTAGFINVNAGGGSLITLPALIFLGLSPAMANCTNRIAIFCGTFSATANFKNKGIFDWKLGCYLSLPAVVGAIIGSSIVVRIPDNIFRIILPSVMILILIIILLNPKNSINHSPKELTMKKKILLGISFFGIGIYGGFIQVGVGFIIMAVLTLITGWSLVTINSLKVFIVMVYTIVSLPIFIFYGKVDVLLGVVLSLGSILGSYLGSNFVIAKGDKW